MKKALLVILMVSLSGCGVVTKWKAEGIVKASGHYKDWIAQGNTLTLDHVIERSDGSYICGVVISKSAFGEEIFVIEKGKNAIFRELNKSPSPGKTPYSASECDEPQQLGDTV